MASKRKVIITSAVTGAIHTPTMSPHLPVTSEEIADAAIGAAEAGAAIVHMHARDPKDGRPSQDPEHFEPILDKLKANTDAVINITTGGSPHMSVEERMLPVATFKPELASLNMGSMNFGLYPMLDRYPSSSTNGSAKAWRSPAIWSSKTPLPTSKPSWTSATATGRASSSSATTSPI